MSAINRVQVFLVCSILMAGDLFPADAGGESRDLWNCMSSGGTVGYLALGIGLPLVEGGAAGREQALRT
ncbi:MAG: hypothetical protein WCL39_12450, partial [Armatimonadota bacterium]